MKIWNKKKIVNNLERNFNYREEVVNFFRYYAKMMLDASYKSKQDRTKREEMEQSSRT